nr:hypothetical protein [uncultured Draconibacterium sp.]
MNNIYIQTLKLGFENPEGISFNEVVEKLNIDLSNTDFRLNYTIWFYSTFYNYHYEFHLFGNKGAKHISTHRLSIDNMEILAEHNNQKSYMKGDAVNKYIDYLELERTRESSKQATLFATGSLIIAILAVLMPYFMSPDSISDSGRIVLVSILFTIAASIYNAIDIAKAKPDKKKNFWSYTIIITVLSGILSFLLISIVNKLVLNPEFWLKTLVILPVFVFWLGQIIRKYRS